MSEFERICALFEPNQNKDQHFVEHLNCFARYQDSNLDRGWERWLQYELLYLLSKADRELREPRFEQSYEYDGRFALPKGKDGKSKARIDFVYETKGSNSDICHAVELKMTRSLRRGIYSGLKDLLRIRAIRDSEWEFRSVCLVAVFMNAPDKSKYIDLLGSLNVKYQRDFRSIEISPSYTALLLGWNAPPRLAYKESFVEWVNNLDQLCQEHGIDVWSE